MSCFKFCCDKYAKELYRKAITSCCANKQARFFAFSFFFHVFNEKQTKTPMAAPPPDKITATLKLRRNFSVKFKNLKVKPNILSTIFFSSSTILDGRLF